MDTSETYIKMCDCPEIQEQKPKADSLIPEIYWGAGAVEDHYNNAMFRIITSPDPLLVSKRSIWLPRQDQLQEMVEYPDLGSILRDLREFWQRFPNHRITSREQLELAFVMKELYNKVWDGDTWKANRV